MPLLEDERERMPAPLIWIGRGAKKRGGDAPIEVPHVKVSAKRWLVPHAW
jgi:hypothetical protein